MGTSPTGNRKLRVAVLFGGKSGEHDVSLRSAQTIMSALDPERFEVVPIGITRTGQWLAGGDPMLQLASESPMLKQAVGETRLVPADEVDPQGVVSEVDVIFPALHGPLGEDGTVQGMLELAGVPYVGSGVLGSAVAMDKAIAKTLLAQAGIPQLPWRLVKRSEVGAQCELVAAALTETLGFPMFVKPANLGSSVGISKAETHEELCAALQLAAHYDRRLVVEKGVVGREIELGVLGNDNPLVSVAGEIIPGSEFYDYEAKYVSDTSTHEIPAQIPPDVQGMMQGYALDAYQALDLAGLARVDFFLERDTDRIYLNEVNTLPGFTSISMYPLLWEASGYPLGVLVERLIELAIDRNDERAQ